MSKRMHVPMFDRVVATISPGESCVHRAVTPESFQNGKWKYAKEDRRVILMAVSGAYAMVCRPRCLPYVCRVKELLPK